MMAESAIFQESHRGTDPMFAQLPSPRDAGRRTLGAGSSRIPSQIENDIPQPQVVAAFGLLITNRDPCRSSR